MMLKRIIVEANQVFVVENTTGIKTKVDFRIKDHVNAEWATNTFTSQPIDHRDSHYNIERYKLALRRAGDELGVSVKEFCRQLNGAIYRAYLEPNIDIHNRFSWLNCFGKRWVRDERMVNLVNNNIAYIRSFLDDGLHHIAGYGLFHHTAQTAKSAFGKKLWKRLCRNSKTRNDTICKHVLRMNIPQSECKDAVRFMNTVPSTLLNKRCAEGMYYITASTGYDNLVGKIIKHLGVPLYKIETEEVDRLGGIVSDAYNMIQRVEGGVFNPRWSLTRLVREHDRASEALLRQQSSDEPYDIVDVLPNTIEMEGFTATLAKSQLELSLIGSTQHHCVASYHHSIKRNMYAVYNIVDEEGVISTLGIDHPKSQYSRDQHYYAYNKPVEDAARLAFANVIKSKVKSIMDKEIEVIVPPPQPVANGDNNDLLFQHHLQYPTVPCGYCGGCYE